VAMQPAGQGSRGATRARNGHTTALFASECQSFLDNVIAGFGQTGSWHDDTEIAKMGAAIRSAGIQQL